MPLLPSRLSSARFLVAFLALAGAGGAFASETTDQIQERVLRMREFFDTMLPGTLEEHNITLHITPKFSDLRSQEYIRFPFELRYGLSKRWELLGGITPFTPNPINSGHDHRWGPGEFKLGARYDLGRMLGFFDDTTLGLETRVPVGRPPIVLNDHYTHVKPTVSTARTLRMWPKTTLYANLSYDRSVELTRRSAPPPEVMRRNVIEIAPGLLFKPSEFAYFAEYRFRHIAAEAESHLAHEVQFGSIWDVPLRRTEKWKLPGKWQLELAYKINQEEGLGTNQGFAVRVNWRTALRGAPDDEGEKKSKFGR